jgi:hypothetical protein
MSIMLNPGYPLPEIACNVVHVTWSKPKASQIGFKPVIDAITEQLGFATMNPPEDL